MSTWLAGALLMTKSKRCSSCFAEALGIAILSGGNKASLITAGVVSALGLVSAAVFSSSFILLSVESFFAVLRLAQPASNRAISNGENLIVNVRIMIFSLISFISTWKLA